jgi:hypothetical protein
MFPNTRLFAKLLCFTFIALTLFLSPGGKTAPVAQAFQDPGYCMADGGTSVVYFSAIYDTKLQHPARMSTNVIASNDQHRQIHRGKRVTLRRKRCLSRWLSAKGILQCH